MNQFQEMLEKKRLKALAEGSPKYKYLFEAISNCVRAYVNGEPTPNSVGPSPFQTETVNFEGLI